MNVAGISPVTVTWQIPTVTPLVSATLTAFGPTWTIVPITATIGDVQASLQPVTATWEIPSITPIVGFTAVHFIDEKMEVHRFVEEEMRV